MPTLAQLQAEPWWGREIVTPELDWLADELCRRTGRPRVAAGTKGDERHLRGAHRSQEWLLKSRYCTDRRYTVQPGLTEEQARHIGGLDFTPGPWGTTANRALMVAQTGRLVTALRAGKLSGVREVIGTLDGKTVYGITASGTRFSADASHLDHWHLTFDRRRLRDRALMQRILETALGITLEDEVELTDRVPSAATPDVPNRTLDMVLGDLWHGVHIRMTDAFAQIQAALAELQARPPVDVDALAAALAQRLPLAPGATLADVRDALAGVLRSARIDISE